MAQIENIEIRFSGSANFKEVYAEAAKLNSQLKVLQASLSKLDDSAVRDLRSAFNMQVREMGGVATESVKAKSATQAFTEALVKQDVTLSKAWKNRRLYNEVLREQYMLQKMVAVQWGKSASGTVSADVMIPKGVSEEVHRLTNSFKANTAEIVRSRIAMAQHAKGTAEATEASRRYSQAVDIMRIRQAVALDTLSSFSSNMVKWGKNTQWAGRQLMVGFTVPFAAFAAVAGMAAYNVDKEMTRILKVYDYSAKAMNDSALREAESNSIRVMSMNAAKQAARDYGIEVKDTLEMEAELAATGMTGTDLIQRTTLLNKAMIMGELDKQQAIKASTALQTAYGHSTQQMADDFNYMATIANATSLSMSDFVEGLPRGAAILENVGVGLQDMGVLMAALKQSGIAAGEGMNGLRSGAQKILQVTPAAEKMWAKLLPEKKPISEIVESMNGQFIPSLTALGESMKGLEQYQRQQIITKIFGIHQSNKMFMVMDSLINKTNQVGKAMEVANMSADELATVAANSLATVQNSASNRIQRAIASIKAEMADIGAVFLPIAASVMQFVGSFLKAFNSMDEGKKKFLLIMAALAAAAGVLTMLIGLTSNFIGTVSGLGVWLAKLGLKFRTTTLEQKAQAMMAEKSANLWRDQGLAAQTLSQQLQLLVKNLDAVAMAQHAATAASNGGVMGTPYQYRATPGKPGPRNGSIVVGTGNGGVRRATPAEIAQQRNMAHLEALAENEERIAAASGTTKRNWAAIAGTAGGVALTGGMLATSMGNAAGASRSLLDNVTNTLMVAALIGPVVAKGLTSSRVTNALTGVKDAFSLGRRNALSGGIGGLAAGLRSALPAAGALAKVIARFAGPVGLLITAGLTIKSIRDGMDEARKAQTKLNESAKDWAAILGFTYTQTANASQAKKDEAAQATNLAKKFREANAEAAKGLDIAAKSKNQEDLLNAAINEGVKARMHGANAGQARLAVQTALAVAGKNETQIKDMMLDVDARINFTSMDSVASAQAKSFAETFRKIATRELKADRWLTRVWEDLQGGGALTSAGEQAAKEIGKEFWNTLQSFDDPTEKKEYFESVEKTLNSGADELMDNINKNRKDKLTWEQLVLDTSKPMPTTGGYNSVMAPQSGWTMATQQIESQKNALSSLTGEQQAAVKQQMQSHQIAIQQVARERGLNEEQVKGIKNLIDLKKVLGIAEYTTSDALKEYNDEVAAAEVGGNKLSEAEKLHILNKWRLAAGLDNATDSAQGFGGALTGASGAVDQFGNAIDSSIMDAEAWATAWTDATKKAMDGAQNAALDEAERLRAKQQEEILEGISKDYERREQALEDRADRKNKAFENRANALAKKHENEDDALNDRQKARQKAVAAAYDGRIKKIQDAIEAEQKAEEIRQRLFEAEKTRLERLAAMANANIDFNVAVNTGNLDEAAKLFNNMQSQQDTWALDDATAGSSDASEARNKARQGQIDNLDKAKDAALESLQKKEDAEKDALKAKQDREKTALDAEKDRYAKSVEAQKKALQQAAANDKKAKEEELRRRKQTLEFELLAIRASTPRNKAEYDAQIKAIQKAYAAYGVDLTAKGNGWATTISTALTKHTAAAAASLRNDINWKAYAAQIANDFSTGAFGMNISEFGEWIRTGKAPKNAFKKDMRVNSTQKGAHGPGGSHEVRHAGGLLGSGGSSRRGYAASNSPMSSEVQLLAKKGEYVVNDKAVRKYGVGIMDEINEGKFGAGMGGADLGLMGILGGGLFAQMKNMMQMGMATAAMRQMESSGSASASVGKAGAYGNIKLDATQLKNAATIMSTGKSLGASKRDLTIALMTAMQESTLRNINFGDRDSLGLFQQRPSMGWGTPEQIMDPAYASTKFFKELFKVKDRDSMPLTAAAQAVQRSAFPDAYAKWQSMAEAIVNGTTFTGGGMGLEAMLKAISANGVAKGNSGLPLTKGKYRVSSEYGMRVNPVTGQYKLHNGIDLAAPGGTPIYASKAGKVLSAGWAGGYGNYTVIAHADGTQSGYAHQSRFNVKPGQQVTAGQHIGAVGTTGNSTGDHLHFQMGRAGDWQNPRSFIPGLSKGGYTLNDGYAMLHKSETVLTADLSDKLRTGLNNLANGANNQYTITVDMRGAVLRDEFDVKSAVKGAVKEVMNEQASKMGRSRKVNA